jgi:sterol 3beta-glucosyltransferase
MSKTITLLTSGTRGDVMPYIALGLGLREAGYNVRIAAPASFRHLIEPGRLTCTPFEGNPSELMVDQGEPLTLGRNPIRSLRATQNFLRQARALYPLMLQTAAEACDGSHALLYGLPTLWGAHIAEGLHIPGIRAVLQPLAPTRQYSSTLLPFRSSYLGIGNWFSHWVLTQVTWLAWRREINRARRTHFNLPPAHWLDPSLRSFPHQPLTLNGFSDLIVPRPKDWNEKQIITGYWRNFGARQPAADAPEQELIQIENFIEHSPQNTIAIGFGSPGTRDVAHIMNILMQALNRAGARAVLTIPSQWHGYIKSGRIFPIEYVPHDWLYPRVRVAVHHGGAGTTSASLHAGIPTVTIPLGIDQFFWGERVYKLGVGTKPIPQRSLNADKLAKAIQQALQDKPMRERAKGISQELCLEDGVQAAVRVMRDIF